MSFSGNNPGKNPFDQMGNVVDVSRHARAIGKGLLTVFAIGLGLIAITSVAFTVQPEERALVKRFGKIVRVNDPGLHFKLPLGIEQVQNVATERILKEEFGFRSLTKSEDPFASFGDADARRTQYSDQDFGDESLMLTGDLNVINVEWVVQYRITDPEKYLYRGIRNPTETLRDVSEAVMRRIVGNRMGSDALTVGRTEIAASAQAEMQDILNSYNSGVSIVRVELQDVTPPDPVKPSFNEVNEARQERERMINEAERQRNEVIPRAIGEARQVIAQAEGYAFERVNRAKGEGTRFLELLGAYKEAPEVMRSRMYLEMIDQVLPTVDKLYLIDGQQTPPLPLLDLGTAGSTKPAVGAASQTNNR
jgi:membrane protease subunit HflK